MVITPFKESGTTVYAGEIKRIPAVNALNGVALISNFGRTNPLPVKAGN
jgi:hypothetical protein